MPINQQKSNPKTCPTGDCPPDIQNLKEIRLSPPEKRAIFFCLKREIFKQKKLFGRKPLPRRVPPLSESESIF